MQEYTGIRTQVPERPLFVTPTGIALHDGHLADVTASAAFLCKAQAQSPA